MNNGTIDNTIIIGNINNNNNIGNSGNSSNTNAQPVVLTKPSLLLVGPK